MEDENRPNRKFKLQGRSEEAARLGTLSVYFEDSREMIMKALSDCSGLQFQMVIKHFDHKDELTFKISGSDLSKIKKNSAKVLEAFEKEKASYKDILAKKLIHPLKIEVVSQSELEANLRTGKLKRIIDLRFK
jgi:phenylacetate-CoA ligase